MRRTPASADRSGLGSVGRGGDLDVEDLLVRNHDFQWGYDLDLRVRDDDGAIVHEARYYLQPGATATEFDVLEPGTYAVDVVLDNDREATHECHVEGTADAILVELGNGAVSVQDRRTG